MPAANAGGDGLTPGQLRGVVVAIALAHLLAVWGVMQVPVVREAVVEAAPIFVNFIAPPAPQAPPVAEPPPPPVPRPVLKQPPPLQPLVTAAPSPAPAPFVAAPPPPEPVPVVQAAPPPADPAPAPPAPAPAPKTIPASAVQYLDAPEITYPRTSQRLGEIGRVMVRVYIDEGGKAREVQLHKSSGFSRLDDEAVRAVRKARFKPYTENGRATAGWAFIPLVFDLEK